MVYFDQPSRDFDDYEGYGTRDDFSFDDFDEEDPFKYGGSDDYGDDYGLDDPYGDYGSGYDDGYNYDDWN